MQYFWVLLCINWTLTKVVLYKLFAYLKEKHVVLYEMLYFDTTDSFVKSVPLIIC